MSNVILFTPKSQHDAKANLLDFIEFAKGLNPLGVDQPFANNEWSAGKAIYLREGNLERMMTFTRLVEVDGKLQKGKQSKKNLTFMKEPFLSFAKAMICYSYAVGPSTAIFRSLATLRHLHVALLRTTGSLCPSGITADVLDNTCQLLLETYKSPSALGLILQSMYATMVESRLVSIPTVWKSFIPKPNNDI